jgi:hypothetical protein
VIAVPVNVLPEVGTFEVAFVMVGVDNAIVFLEGSLPMVMIGNGNAPSRE